ncbi:MAG: MaoC family dehydratase [Siculibacillus sp.]|nr:MaoC family dehydratase [Siculibacillus sp.]
MTATTDAAVTAAGSLGTAELGDLARLVADVCGVPAGPTSPFAAPLLLFARLDDARRRALFAPRPGRVLVQEQLAIEASGRLAADKVVSVRFRFGEPANEIAAFRIEADLVGPDEAPLAAIHTSIRPVEAASLAAAIGLPFPPAADSPGRSTRPLDAEIVGRWLRLVGDENPIHTDAGHAASLGLAGPVVPGALLAAAAEDLAGAPGMRLRRLNMRFMAPIPLGATVTTRTREKPDASAAGRRDLRLFFLCGDRAAAVADLGFTVAAD